MEKCVVEFKGLINMQTSVKEYNTYNYKTNW